MIAITGHTGNSFPLTLSIGTTYPVHCMDLVHDNLVKLLKSLEEISDVTFIRKKYDVVSFDSIKKRRVNEDKVKCFAKVKIDQHRIIKQPHHRISEVTRMYRNHNLV